MRESPLSEEPSLAAIAFLYASGELTAEDAAAFEQRLGEEQAARDALCYAVLLTQTLEGQPAPMPSPAYREKVRQRLRPGGFGSRFLSRRSYRGHPALWTGLGMAAALLLMLIWPHPRSPVPLAPAPASVASSLTPAPAPEAAAETAQRWANLPTSERLTRARREEKRRRIRAEDPRLARGEERLRPFQPHEPKR